MRADGRPSKTPSGFSLVELLIVITIIGLLLAILAPALTAVQDLTNNVACQSNLAQIAKAVKGYAAENHGAIPPTRYESSGLHWCNILVIGGYISAPNTYELDDDEQTDEKNVFFCPITSQEQVTDTDLQNIAAPDDDLAQGWYRVGSADYKVDCSYYWNGCTELDNPTDPDDDFLNDFPSLLIDKSQGRLLYHNIAEIRRQHTMAMVMDGVYYDGHKYPAAIAARHPGDYGRRCRTNVVYYDGHVGFMTRRPDTDSGTGEPKWENETADEEGAGLTPIMPREALEGGPPFFRLKEQKVTAPGMEEDEDE